nr:protein POLLENLESS 3-LIKE 2 [Ipomoea batatas]
MSLVTLEEKDALEMCHDWRHVVTFTLLRDQQLGFWNKTSRSDHNVTVRRDNGLHFSRMECHATCYYVVERVSRAELLRDNERRWSKEVATGTWYHKGYCCMRKSKKMLQEMWNGPPGFRPTKSAPASPAKPLGVARTRSDSFHVAPKVPVGDSPYVRAKNVQLVEKDPEKAIPLFWAAINAGDRVDSALKDMAIVMKQQNRAEEAIEAIKSLRNRCSDQAQEALDNILLDLYKRCGRLDDQIALLRHKLFMIQQGLAFNGKRTKTARSQGKKFQVSVDQEATRLLGNLGWALMQQSNYIEAEDAYRRALAIAADNNKMCNLGICLMQQGRVREAKETLRRVKPAVSDGPRGVDSHLKAYERAQQMLQDLESVVTTMVKMRRQSISPEEEKWADLKLPDNKEFEDAIIAAVLDSSSAETTSSKLEQQHCPPRKIEKRLKVFQDITLSLSPKA